MTRQTDYQIIRGYQDAIRKAAMDLITLSDTQDFRKTHLLAAWLAQLAGAAERRCTTKD
jgi:hypothetical protein